MVSQPGSVGLNQLHPLSDSVTWSPRFTTVSALGTATDSLSPSLRTAMRQPSGSIGPTSRTALPISSSLVTSICWTSPVSPMSVIQWARSGRSI